MMKTATLGSQSTTQQFLTLNEVAELLMVTTRTVQNFVSRGDMPQPLRFGPKLVRFRSEDVQKWIADGCPRKPSDN